MGNPHLAVVQTGDPLLSGIRPCSSGPVLASDVLREDLAPLCPAATAARWLGGLAALVFLSSDLLGTVPAMLSWRERLMPLTESFLPWSSLTVALGLIALAALPFSYAIRALGLGALGVTLVVQGCLGHGPLGALLLWPTGGAYPWELERVVAASAVPTALMFRARYRAYPTARFLLAMAVTLALPFAWHTGFLLMTSSSGWVRASSGGVLLALAVSLVGFMDARTTAMGGTCALGLILAMTLHVLVQAVAEPVAWIDPACWHRALPFLAVTSILAVGMFQLLALVLANDARKVNVFLGTEETNGS